MFVKKTQLREKTSLINVQQNSNSDIYTCPTKKFPTISDTANISFTTNGLNSYISFFFFSSFFFRGGSKFVTNSG